MRYNYNAYVDWSLGMEDRYLMHILQSGTVPSDKDMKILLAGLDMDKAGQNYLLMLSCLGHKYGWNLFPDSMVARLKGLHRYHQVHNAMGGPMLTRCLRQFSEEGIRPMFLKGTAMLAHYAPGRLRLMWDYDMAVPEEKFDTAIRILEADGGRRGPEAMHSVAIRKNDCEIDLHRFVFKTHGENGKGMWDEACGIDFHGEKAFVPSRTDMLIHMMDTYSRNYFRREGMGRSIQWFMDFYDIWTGGALDLKQLSWRAWDLGSLERTKMGLSRFSSCFPELLSDELISRHFPDSDSYRRLMSAGYRYQAQLDKFRKHNYNATSRLTPVHLWRSFWLEVARYVYIRPELRRNGVDPGFFGHAWGIHGEDFKRRLGISGNGGNKS